MNDERRTRKPVRAWRGGVKVLVAAAILALLGAAPGEGATPSCPADCNGDGVVDVIDLLDVLGSWGPCPGCAADINGDDVVDVSDALAVLAEWGPCP